MGDIRQYVYDNFNNHQQLQKYADNKRYGHLIDEIVKRANGVFLWVTLVVRSLRRGLIYADTISDLERRLDSLPPDLETFFKQILDSVDPFYKSHATELLILATHTSHTPRGCLSVSLRLRMNSLMIHH